MKHNGILNILSKAIAGEEVTRNLASQAGCKGVLSLIIINGGAIISILLFSFSV